MMKHRHASYVISKATFGEQPRRAAIETKHWRRVAVMLFSQGLLVLLLTAFVLLQAAQPMSTVLVVILSLQLISVLVSLFSLRGVLDRRQDRWRAGLLMFLVPLIGPLMMMTLLLQPNRLGERVEKRGFAQIKLADLPREGIVQHQTLTLADCREIIIHARSVNRKKAVLDHLERVSHPDVVSILQLAMADEKEEIRLLATSRVRMIEEGLNQQIAVQQDRFQTFAKRIKADAQLNKTEQQAHALAALRVAESLYDLVYLKIADSTLFAFYLEQAMNWVGQSLKVLDTPLARLLKAKIALMQNRPSQAHSELILAGSRLCQSVVAPFLAEVAFQQKSHRLVATLLRQTSEHNVALSRMRPIW